MLLGKSFILFYSQDENTTVKLTGVLWNRPVLNFSESLLGLLSSALGFNRGSGRPFAGLSPCLRGRHGRPKTELGRAGIRDSVGHQGWYLGRQQCPASTLEPLFGGPAVSTGRRPAALIFLSLLLLIIDSKPSHCSLFSTTPWNSDLGHEVTVNSFLHFPFQFSPSPFTAYAPTSFCLPVYTFFLFLSSPNL